MQYLTQDTAAVDMRAMSIRAVVTDIDGVLTNGTFGYATEDTMKFFDAHDGQGLVIVKDLGFVTGVISGKSSEANRRRARELRLDFCCESVDNKIAMFLKVCHDFALKPSECLYVGDDLPDIPVLRAVGVGVAVANASPHLDRFALLKTQRTGGHGAVREAIDWLLQRQGKLEETVMRYANLTG
ncbi:MAG: KdsC family phosphatase [Thermoguttaceae bacterium]